MFREMYGVYEGTTAVLPHTFELLSLVQCPGNPHLSKYTSGLVRNGFRAAESRRAKIESQFLGESRWARKEYNGNKLGVSFARYCSVVGHCYERKQAWRAEAFRDWRDDYDSSRRRFLIGTSWGAIMVPEGDDQMRRVLWYAEILCRMVAVPDGDEDGGVDSVAIKKGSR